MKMHCIMSNTQIASGRAIPISRPADIPKVPGRTLYLFHSLKQWKCQKLKRVFQPAGQPDQLQAQQMQKSLTASTSLRKHLIPDGTSAANRLCGMGGEDKHHPVAHYSWINTVTLIYCETGGQPQIMHLGKQELPTAG